MVGKKKEVHRGSTLRKRPSDLGGSPMTLEDKVHALLHVLHRAEELGNVSVACREAGISRTLFCRWKKRFTRYGAVGLHSRQTGQRRGRPPQLGTGQRGADSRDGAGVAHMGPERLSLQLARQGCLVSPSMVWRALRRVGFGTRIRRLLARSRDTRRRAPACSPRGRNAVWLVRPLAMGRLKSLGSSRASTRSTSGS